MEPMKIMNQEEVQKFLLSRGGNKTQGFDNWEGFTDFPDNKNTNPTKENNKNNEKNENNNKNIKKGIPKYEPEPKFYNGDQILKGDYFKGWNDTYFFQSSVFRENNNFWLNPFK